MGNQRLRALEEASGISACTPPFSPPNSSSGPGGGGLGGSGGSGDSGTSSSFDPNELVGPAGFGAQNWIASGTLLPYQISFENLGPGSRDANGDPYPIVASAPAQRVTVTNQLSEGLNWESFELTGIGFGDTVIPVPSGVSHYVGTVQVTQNGKTFDVEITAGIDYVTGLVSVVFQSINPLTGLPPDVLTGFLPPEDETGRGMGHVSYLIQAKDGLPTGTEIRNVAEIRFDVNDVITTDQINPLDASEGIDVRRQALVTLDGGIPDSVVTELPVETDSGKFTVDWTGDDEGSGIAFYDIYVSTDGGQWELWLGKSLDTSMVFDGDPGVSYAFYSIATDFSGNTEIRPVSSDASTTVVANIPIQLLNLTITTTVEAGSKEVQIEYPLVPGFDHTIEYSSALLTEQWRALPEAPHNTGSLIDRTDEKVRFYRLRVDRK